MEQRILAIAEGRVQGVGYRWFIQRHAEQLGLHGYVRNLTDGRVEIDVQGDAAMVEALLQKARIGPFGAHVASLKIEQKPLNQAVVSPFEIRK